MTSDDARCVPGNGSSRASERATPAAAPDKHLAVGFHFNFAKDEEEEVGGAVAEVGRAM